MSYLDIQRLVGLSIIKRLAAFRPTNAAVCYECDITADRLQVGVWSSLMGLSESEAGWLAPTACNWRAHGK